MDINKFEVNKTGDRKLTLIVFFGALANCDLFLIFEIAVAANKNQKMISWPRVGSVGKVIKINRQVKCNQLRTLLAKNTGP